MQILNDTLIEFALGDPTVRENLAVFPLLTGKRRECDYLTLDEALEGGLAEVSEVSEGGSVPELSFENHSARKVLLVDGEELIGAKQNRVLNLAILVAAAKKVVIPVSCVERGRWAYRQRRFASGRKKLYAKARAAKMAAVSESMRRSGARRSDQGGLWLDIARKSDRMEACSETGAMDALYDKSAVSVKRFEQAFQAREGQVGAVFAVNGEIAGLELFDSPSAFAKYLSMLVESYAVDALDVPEVKREAPSKQAAEAFIDRVRRASVQSFPGVDLGEDVRLTGENLTGGALIAEGRVVHLSAFSVEKENATPETDDVV
ncbi:MAG: ARPP-1 family domain-containing protein [Chromatiales bacterium]